MFYKIFLYILTLSLFCTGLKIFHFLFLSAILYLYALSFYTTSVCLLEWFLSFDFYWVLFFSPSFILRPSKLKNKLGGG